MIEEHGAEIYQLDIGVNSIVGAREEQQDAVLVEPDVNGTVVAVCDGMGGLIGGKQASATAIEALKTLFSKRSRDQLGADFYMHAVDALDESICALQKDMSGKMQAGTTIVSAMITNGHLYWLSVGDSRLYIGRGDELACVTTDHNYFYLINDALRSGQMTTSEYQRESMRGNSLISFIGMGGVELVDVNKVPFVLKHGDTLILTSDGIHQNITDSEMLQAVKQCVGAQALANRFIDMVLKKHNKFQDNASVIVVQIMEA